MKAALLHNNLHQNPRKETNKKKKSAKDGGSTGLKVNNKLNP